MKKWNTTWVTIKMTCKEDNLVKMEFKWEVIQIKYHWHLMMIENQSAGEDQTIFKTTLIFLMALIMILKIQTIKK